MQVLFEAARIMAILAGVFVVYRTALSAIRTFVLPRSAYDRVSSAIFRLTRKAFDLRMRFTSTYERRDRILALYVPVSLLTLLVTWLALVLIGYWLLFWGLGVSPARHALDISGSSLFTLGFATAGDTALSLLTYTEAIVGLTLLALLIAYLPTMYAAFSKRESLVTLLEVRAGSPPSAVTMFLRYSRLGRWEKLNELWESWEVWFADVEESHTSLAALAFYRSPRPERSWITAAGAVLDAAALASSTLDMPRDVQEDLTLRAGYLALRHICDFFGIAYNPNPTPGDPISISRAEFDEACAQMEAGGIALKADRDQAWRDFTGWRVNYDAPLIALAHLTLAPLAPWSSDRPRPQLRATRNHR